MITLTLDVIFEGMKDSIPTTGLGTLFIPTSASAALPVPAMIVLHGSGGITPGREMKYGELLAQNGLYAELSRQSFLAEQELS